MAEILRCECGFEARGDDEDGLAAAVRGHASRVHQMTLTVSEALLLTRRAGTTLRMSDSSQDVGD